MFDPAVEIPVRLNDVPRIEWLPARRGGSRLNIATVHRWATKGVRGVVLETLKIGATRVTSEPALKRFFESISNPAIAAGIERPESQRKKSIDRAREACERAGI